MALPNRKFGVEIECHNVDRIAIERSLRALGIECRYEGYTHNAMPHWKIVTDGSLTRNDSYEFVSPPLSGPAGIEQVAAVCRVLVQHGANVSRECGLHVHVDAADLSANDIKSSVYRYNKHEATIDSLMPASRRNNIYCASMRRVAERLQSYSEGTGVRYMCEEVSNDSRYWKLNLASYLRHGTLEFRQHSGTVNAEKICNWIKFCVHFIEASKVRVIQPRPQPAASVTLPAAAATQGRKAKQNKIKLLERLLRFGSVDTAEMAPLLEMTPASVGAVICQLRVQHNINIKRERGTFKFFLTTSAARDAAQAAHVALSGTAVPVMPRATTPATTGTPRIVFPHTNSEDTLYDGMPPEVVNYYNERSQELAA